MNSTLLLTAVLGAALCATAQSGVPADSAVTIVDAINASGTISVEQPAAVAPLVGHTLVAPGERTGERGEAAPQTRTAYRVQVFDDNNPANARARANSRRAVYAEAFPEWGVYVTFRSPYWQVRVGDFRSRIEAEAAMEHIRAAFPAEAPYMRVVRERIR